MSLCGNQCKEVEIANERKHDTYTESVEDLICEICLETNYYTNIINTLNNFIKHLKILYILCRIS